MQEIIVGGKKKCRKCHKSKTCIENYTPISELKGCSTNRPNPNALYRSVCNSCVEIKNAKRRARRKADPRFRRHKKPHIQAFRKEHQFTKLKDKEWAIKILETLNGKCPYCNNICIKYTVDHIEAIGVMGPTTAAKGSVMFCCYDCNHRKGCLTLEEFAGIMGFNPKEIRKLAEGI
jgi:hypothetical protein